MRKLILFVFTLMLLPLVVAATYSQNSVADIKHPVRVNDGLPSSAANCNISIYYPNGTTFIPFGNMTISDDNNYFNYTLNTSQTTIIGTYLYDVTCVDGSFNATDTFSFLINLGGVEPTEERTGAITRGVYFVFIIGLVLFLAFLFSRTKLPVKLTLLLLSGLSFLIALNLIFLDLQDAVVNPAVVGFFSSFTAISFYIYWGIGMAIGIIWIFALIMTWVDKRNRDTMRNFGYG